MATRGYIEIQRQSDTNDKGFESSIIHAIHDGYVDNMIHDILSIPEYIYKRIREKGSKFEYIYDMFSGRFDKDGKPIIKSFEQLKGRWSSVIPLSSAPWTFSSFLIALDPLMYVPSNIDYKYAQVLVSFDRGRTPNCIVKINPDDFNINHLSRYTEYIDKLNSKLINTKVRIIQDEEQSFAFQMNIDDRLSDDVKYGYEEDGKWIESDDKIIVSKQSCIEFRHGHSFDFMWWVEGVFRETLGEFYDAQMWDDGVGDCGEPRPERYKTFKDYVCNGETDPEIVKQLKGFRFNSQMSIIPKELIDKLKLDF